MNKLCVALLAAAIITGPALAQTPAPATAAPAAGTVKAIQPGLLEVTGPRVNDVIAAGILKITATPGKGYRSIVVESPWGVTYLPWPKDQKQVAFSIVTGKPKGTATISAPGFTQANAEDYKAAITSILPYAIARTQDNKKFHLREG